ncbi:hypothetical protein ACFE04_016593 [Oxalis oulophora]
MGELSNPLLVSPNLNKTIGRTRENGSLWSTTQSQSKRKLLQKKCDSKVSRRSNNKVLIKRRRVLESSRSPANAIQKKVRTLKKLVPSGTSDESMGLDGLFNDTVDYIVSLQMRVRVMQTMVKKLSGSDE